MSVITARAASTPAAPTLAARGERMVKGQHDNLVAQDFGY